MALTNDNAERSNTADRDWRALKLGAVALLALGHISEYELPRINKPIDVPGLNAYVIPDFAHNSGYDIHLRSSELVVNTPGNYSVTLFQGEKTLHKESFTVSNAEPMIVNLGGTSRGGFLNPSAGFGWANYPGDFKVTIVQNTKDGSSVYSTQF